VRSGAVRLVLDTNTAVSGLIWGGVPGRLIDAAAAGTAQIVSSVPLLDELHDVLFRKKFTAKLAEQGADAAEGFDHTMGARFSTYASYWIKRALINSGNTIRIALRRAGRQEVLQDARAYAAGSGGGAGGRERICS
jgi:hypothetical protein